MTQLNPITSAIIVNQQTVTRQDAAQSAHIQRAQARQRNITSNGDRYEPETVESVEKSDAAHDENKKRQPPDESKGKKKLTGDGKDAAAESSPHLDLTA